VKRKQIPARTSRNSVGVSLLVAEFDEGSCVIELLDDGPNLAASKSPVGYIRQQRHDVQNNWSSLRHYSTQQVTKTGTTSPVRTIQIVLTTALWSVA
jgi:hypothetical protein